MKEEILKFFKGDVEDNVDILKTYSHDASLLEVKPSLILFPKDSKDVQNIVKWVYENKNKYTDPEKNKGWDKLSITARCAGTCMSGGPLNESIILDFSKYMNRFVSLQGDEITVESGMFYKDFEKITQEKGLILPCFTASKNLNAMGGMYANNSGGERTLKYGKTEDYIVEAKVVLSDGNEYIVKKLSQKELQNKIAQNDFEGNLYKNIYNLIQENSAEIKKAKPNVHKNSAGYYLWNVISENFEFDLNKLLVGSQGTLGIVTEITFKLIPKTKYSKLVAIFINDIKSLGGLADEILTLNPETIESYDDKTMKLAVKFFPDFLKNKGFIGMVKFMWSFLPEVWMMLMGGFSKLILLVEFSAQNEDEVNKKCLKLKEKIKNFKTKIHITKLKTEAEKYWDIRRESFALSRKHIVDKRTAPFIDDIIVRPEFLPKFLPELSNILNQYNLEYTITGHAGDGNFNIIPLMDFNREDTAKIITELSDKVYDLVLKYHGSITAEHNDGIIRTPYLLKMYGEHINKLFKETKDIFDPKNIFNPGKKVSIINGIGTKEFLTSHIIKADHQPQDHRI